eukprot:4697025-Prymnesium_polylepis.2
MAEVEADLGTGCSCCRRFASRPSSKRSDCRCQAPLHGMPGCHTCCSHRLPSKTRSRAEEVDTFVGVSIKGQHASRVRTCQINLPIGTSACPTPHSNTVAVLDHQVCGCACGPNHWCTDNLAEGALSLASRACALNATVTRHASTHISLIPHLINPPIRAGAPATPYTNVGAHLPVDHIPGLWFAGVVLRPFQSVQLLVGAPPLRRGRGALEHPP